jgi:hypothetical protein
MVPVQNKPEEKELSAACILPRPEEEKKKKQEKIKF